MMQFVKGDQQRLKRRGKRFAWLAIVLFFFCFIAIPLGNFFIWLFIGAMAYCTFFSIYNFLLASKTNYRHRKKGKESPQEREISEHIRYHLPIVISLLLGGLLLAIIILLFFSKI